MKKLIDLMILCALSLMQVHAQPITFYSKFEIIQDLDYFITDLENIHPDLYHAVTKEDILERVQTLKEQLPDSLSKWETWFRFEEICALFREGHTMLHPPSDEIADSLRFPFTVHIEDSTDHFIVSGSINETVDEHLGDRILSINDISTDSLIVFFRKGVAAENENYFRI